MNTPPVIPDHSLRRCIGRGAYGEVWLARNIMGAPRAVKIVWRGRFDSERPYEREFAGIQRYEPVSRSADGLVHVLHVGRNDAEGYFYYVMELADSSVPLSDGFWESDVGRPEDTAELTPLEAYMPRTMRSDLRRLGRLPVADCLRVALDIVSGLARLHERGLVHRDVKPGNIIFVDGRAKLADIGLLSTGSEGRTFVGTEGYIPPEGPGSASADLYALGVGLYEAATGYSPDQFPRVPPEWFAEEAGPEMLEFHEVVLKACEADRTRRYQSADQMQADLALLQSGQSVRRVRQLERRAVRTQRFAWAGAIIVTTALAAAIIANWQARLADRMRQRESSLLQEARDARSKESEARARAQDAERDARRQLNSALSEQARALVLSKELGHRTRALDAIRRADGSSNPPELRRVVFSALGLPDLRLQHELRLDPGITLLQPDPKLERVAIGFGSGPVTILSLTNLPKLEQPVGGLAQTETLATLPASTNRDCYQALWSPDGRFLALKRQHDNGGIRSDWEVWNTVQTQRVFNIGPDIARTSVTFHPRRPWLMAGRGGGTIVEWDAETGRELRSFNLPNTAHILAYSPDGSRVAACYREGSKWMIAFHSSTNFETLRAVEWPESIELLSWHPQGRWVCGYSAFVSPWARGVRLIETETGDVTFLGDHKIKMAYSEFTADGNYLFSGGWDREVICWDLRTSQRAFTHPGTGYRHYWSTDGRRCALALPDNLIQFYAFERPSYRTLSGHRSDTLRDGRFSPDGRWLVARDAHNLCLWDLTRPAPAALVDMSIKATAFFFSPDSTELFAVPDEYSQRGYLGRWRMRPGSTPMAPPEVDPLPVDVPKGLTRAAFVGSNELLMTSEEGVRMVALTNLAAGPSRVVQVPEGLGYTSPDGRWLAMLYDYSPLVRVYELPSMREVALLQTKHYVGFITFAPKGDEMLVINRSGAEWFDTKTWRCSRRQSSTPVSGSYAFYTPDGNGIWMVTHFRNAALLDRYTLEPLLPLPSDVLPLAISPDGRQLAVSVEGRWLQLWDLPAFREELARLKLDW